MKNYFSDRYNKLLFYDIAVHENTGWFCNRLYSVLFRMDLQSGKIDMEAILPTESNNDIEQYAPIAYYADKLVIAPRNGKSILIYDLKSKKIEKIKFDFTEFDDKSRYNLFTNIHIVENVAYIVPGRYHAVIKLNLDTFQVEYLDSWYEKIMESSIDTGKVFSVFSIIENLRFLKMADWQNSQIIEIDLKSGYSTINKIRGTEGITSFDFQGLHLIAHKNGKNIINIDTNTEIELNVPNIACDYKIWRIVASGNMIYVFPLIGNMIISIDNDKFIQKEFLHLPSVVSKEMQGIAFQNTNFLCVKQVSEKYVIVCSLYEDKIYLFNLEKGTYRCFSNDVEMNVCIETKIAEYYFSNFEIEKGEDEIEDWLESIKNNRIMKKEINTIQCIGQTIYQGVEKRKNDM